MILPFGSIACRSIMSSVIRPETDSGMMVNAIPGSAKKCSASARNLCSPSSRNPVHLDPGIAFTFPGIRTLEGIFRKGPRCDRRQVPLRILRRERRTGIGAVNVIHPLAGIVHVVREVRGGSVSLNRRKPVRRIRVSRRTRLWMALARQQMCRRA